MQDFKPAMHVLLVRPSVVPGASFDIVWHVSKSLCLRRKLESLASNYFGLTIALKSWLHWAALILC